MAKQSAKLWAVIKREYVERVRSRWFVIATVFGPLIFGALIFLPSALSHQAQDPATTALYNITVIDATTTGLGERVAQLLGGGKYANQPMPEVRVVPADQLVEAERNSQRDVMDRHASGYLVIDSQTVAEGSAFYAGRRADADMDMLQVKDAIREGLIGLHLEQFGMSPGRIDSVTIVTPSLRTQHLGDNGPSTFNESRFALAIFVAFLLYMSIIFYGQSMLSGVIEEKTTRVAEVVVSSVSPETLLAGKVIGVSAVGLTQQIIWIVGALLILVYRAHTATPPAFPGASTAAGPSILTLITSNISLAMALELVLFFLLGFIFFGSLYAAVGATVSNESEARQAAQPVIILLIISVIFIQPVATAPTSTMAHVLTLLPFSSPILMPLRMALTDVAPAELGASLVILLLSCVGAVWLAARIYRVGLLMYGKRPTWSELRHWIGQR
jgi:ABC-2 type transport system permease protein